MKKNWKTLRKDWENGGNRLTFKNQIFNPRLSSILKALIHVSNDFFIVEEINFLDIYILCLNRSIEPEITRLGSPILIVACIYNPNILSTQILMRMDLNPKISSIMHNVESIIAITLETVDEGDISDFKRNLNHIGKKGVILDIYDINSMVLDGCLISTLIRKVH